MKLEFEDAQALAVKHPDTFVVHPIEALLALVEPGDYVKVCCSDPGERFWVMVDHVDKTNELLRGRVANQLVFMDLKYNEEVQFEFRHIYDYQPGGAPVTCTEEDNVVPVHEDCN